GHAAALHQHAPGVEAAGRRQHPALEQVAVHSPRASAAAAALGRAAPNVARYPRAAGLITGVPISTTTAPGCAATIACCQGWRCRSRTTSTSGLPSACSSVTSPPSPQGTGPAASDGGGSSLTTAAFGPTRTSPSARSARRAASIPPPLG